MAMCRKHRVELICPACIGEEGGDSRSYAKMRASKQNLKLAWNAKRKYTRCSRYPSHHWSAVSGKCPCGARHPNFRPRKPKKRGRKIGQKAAQHD